MVAIVWASGRDNIISSMMVCREEKFTKFTYFLQDQFQNFVCWLLSGESLKLKFVVIFMFSAPFEKNQAIFKHTIRF